MQLILSKSIQCLHSAQSHSRQRLQSCRFYSHFLATLLILSRMISVTPGFNYNLYIDYYQNRRLLQAASVSEYSYLIACTSKVFCGYILLLQMFTLCYLFLHILPPVMLISVNGSTGHPDVCARSRLSFTWGYLLPDASWSNPPNVS